MGWSVLWCVKQIEDLYCHQCFLLLFLSICSYWRFFSAHALSRHFLYYFNTVLNLICLDILAPNHCFLPFEILLFWEFVLSYILYWIPDANYFKFCDVDVDFHWRGACFCAVKYDMSDTVSQPKVCELFVIWTSHVNLCEFPNKL